MNSCILFKGCKDTGGYGLKRYKNKLYKAHRLEWIQKRGDIPDGLFVCHHCDNPACINLEHLFLGTNSDNMKDMYSKGRGNNFKGEGSPCSKLTRVDVVYIRELLKLNITQQKIADTYKVDRTLISQIKGNKIWK